MLFSYKIYLYNRIGKYHIYVSPKITIHLIFCNILRNVQISERQTNLSLSLIIIDQFVISNCFRIRHERTRKIMKDNDKLLEKPEEKTGEKKYIKIVRVSPTASQLAIYHLARARGNEVRWRGTWHVTVSSPRDFHNRDIFLRPPRFFSSTTQTDVWLVIGVTVHTRREFSFPGGEGQSPRHPVGKTLQLRSGKLYTVCHRILPRLLAN